MERCPSPSPTEGTGQRGHVAQPPRLALTGVSKEFGGTWVLRDVSLAVAAGRIHAVAGLNGSGKSTLVRAVYGAHEPTTGEIAVDGRPCRFRSPRDALAAGIAAVPQELPVVPELSVTENIFIGMLPGRGGLFDQRAAQAQAEAIIRHLHGGLDPAAPVGSLGLAQQQLVTIARALVRRATVIVFDEPTSALPAAAARRLRDVMRTLRGDGKAVLFISQRLDDVFDVADEVTVLRDGRVVAQGPASGFTRQSLIHWMVAGVALPAAAAREAAPPAATAAAPPGPAGPAAILSVRDLSLPGRLAGVSLDVFPGELVGLFGLPGSGVTEILRALFGAEPAARGTIRLAGEPLGPGIRHRIDRGMAYVTGHRQASLVPGLSVAANIALPAARRPARWLRRHREHADTAALIGSLRIQPPVPALPVSALSGGNQQKVLLARWLAGTPALWLLDDPTRGVDVQAQADIHRIVRDRVGHGSGSCGLIYSSDLRELHAICDRGLIVTEGRVTGEVRPRELTEDQLRQLLEPPAAASARQAGRDGSGER